MNMSPKKLERLIRTMREQGVDYLKAPEIEIRFRDKPMDAQLARPSTPHTPAPVRVVSVPAPPTGAAIPPVDDSGIPHHTNEVKNLLRLSDEDLVDKLFPDYTQQVGS